MNLRNIGMTIASTAMVAGFLAVGWSTTITTARAATTGLGPYPGPTTNVCITGDVWVGTDSNAPIMCWPENNCPNLASLTELNGCPVEVKPTSTSTPTPVPTPRITIFPGERVGTKVVHPVATPAPAELTAHPDDYVWFDGSFWSF